MFLGGPGIWRVVDRCGRIIGEMSCSTLETRADTSRNIMKMDRMIVVSVVGILSSFCRDDLRYMHL